MSIGIYDSFYQKGQLSFEQNPERFDSTLFIFLHFHWVVCLRSVLCGWHFAVLSRHLTRPEHMVKPLNFFEGSGLGNCGLDALDLVRQKGAVTIISVLIVYIDC